MQAPVSSTTWKFTDVLNKSAFRTIAEQQLTPAFWGDSENVNRLIDHDFFIRHIQIPSQTADKKQMDPGKCAKNISTSLYMASEVFITFHICLSAIVDKMIETCRQFSEAKAMYDRPSSVSPQLGIKALFYSIDQVPRLFVARCPVPRVTISVGDKPVEGYVFPDPSTLEWHSIVEILDRFKEKNSAGIPLYFTDQVAQGEGRVVESEEDWPKLMAAFEMTKALVKNIRDHMPTTHFIFDWHKKIYQCTLQARHHDIPPESEADDAVITWISLEIFFSPSTMSAGERVRDLDSCAFVSLQNKDPKQCIPLLRRQLDLCKERIEVARRDPTIGEI